VVMEDMDYTELKNKFVKLNRAWIFIRRGIDGTI
jgi:hypothetical protein